MTRFDGSSDAELLSDGTDPAAAFALLYERHVEDLLRYFVRRTGCAQTAADLTSETFAAALQSRHRFRDTGAPGRAWLFTIARRQLARFIRTEQVADRARRRLGLERLALSETDIERVEQLVDMEPIGAELRRAVNDLSAGQLEAVELRVAQGLPYATVAARLGCSEGAARVRVSRGLVALAEAMGDPS